MYSTRAFIPRILLAFDFDGTLASDSLDAVLGLYGLDRAEWERAYEAPLGRHWDQITRRGQALIELGRDRGEPLTREVLRRAAARVRLHDGAVRMPDRLGEVAREIFPDAEIEVVVLSSGYAEIIEATEIGRRFDRTFASSFHFGADGQAVCMKRIVGHPQKALYLEAIAKDLSVNGANAPESAGAPVDEHERHVSYDQMVYVGDGASDLHAFGFMRSVGGLSIAIGTGERWENADVQRPDQRVDNIARPDYRPGAELMQSLEHAVRACAARIALRAAGKGE